MLFRLLKIGLVAGFLTAIVYTLVQAVTVTPLILEAERYEQATPSLHSHSSAVATPRLLVRDDDAAAHGDRAMWAPEDGMARLFYTFLANLVIGAGFGLVLVAGMALRGRPVDTRTGLIWGLAGFAAFTLAPALGLPPEVPGAAAADLTARQVWWASTVAATAAGLALLAFAENFALKALGIIALVAPHVIGAPHPEPGIHGSVPPELAAHFVVRTLATAALFWAVLGATCGTLWRRFR